LVLKGNNLKQSIKLSDLIYAYSFLNAILPLEIVYHALMFKIYFVP
jgi:hypothetical protein